MDFYTISRDRYERNENGELIKKERKYLRVTKSGRYIWMNDLQRSSEFSNDESEKIIENLRRNISSRFVYHRIWQY